MWEWSFFEARAFQILTAVVAYLFGAALVIKQRMRHPAARTGVRRQAGSIMLAIIYVPAIGILIYLAVQHGVLAALSSYMLAWLASYLLAIMKGLLYPFLE